MATIMIVEDDRQTNDAVAEYLKSFGYRMLSAYDGDEALQLFECNNIDLIILDIMIPKKTGLAVLHTIRAKSSVPILMLTAIGDEYTQVTSFDEQADDYITKPFSMVLLGRRVTALLRRSGQTVSPDIMTFGDVTMLASGTIYLLAPMMGENSVLSEGTYVDGMSSAIRTAAIPRNTEIAHTILRSLPYTIAICIVVSLLCAYFFSKAITNPIKGILDATNHMAVLDRKAACKTATDDEIGILANQINQLYQNLLSTIEHLQEEKDKVSEAEKQKILALSYLHFAVVGLI